MISLSFLSCKSSFILPLRTVSDSVANEKVLNNSSNIFVVVVVIIKVATTSKKVIFNPSTPTQQLKAFLLCPLVVHFPTFANVKCLSLYLLFARLDDNLMTVAAAASETPAAAEGVVLQCLFVLHNTLISKVS